MIVDGHVHVSDRWYEPVESLLHQLDRNGVERAVLVQLIGQTDNDYQQECRRRWPDRFASVVWIDPATADAVDRLETLVGEGASGLRLRPTARSAGEDPLAIWRAAERLGIAVSTPGDAGAFASGDFAALVDEVPDLIVVLEHLGARIGQVPGGSQRDAILALAQHVNVRIKFGGLGEFARRAPLAPADEAERPFERPVPTLIEDACVAFGPDRLMWGSDHPVVSSREGYAHALAWSRARLASFPEEVVAQAFGATAAATFPLELSVRSV